MKVIIINSKNISENDINEIAGHILKGDVLAYPTDTVYGLGCIATNEKSVEKIFKIKKRNRNKPLLILVKSFCMLRKYCYVSNKQYNYLKSVWPGPVTVILKSRANLPENVTAGLENIAVRLPKDDFLTKIIKRVNIPLISTSLNVTGKKPVNNIKNILKYFTGLKPDLVIDDKDFVEKKPSKIIDITDINNIKLIRD